MENTETNARLDEKFIDGVVDYAEKIIREGKQLIWMFHGRSNKNNVEYIVLCPWKDDDEKRHILTSIRLFTVIHEIDEYIVVSEAWMRTAKETEPNKIDPRVSQHPDRKECLIVMHVKRENEKNDGRLRMYLMHRDAKDALTSLERQADYKEIGGEMADLITPKTPPEEMREQVKQAWELGRSIGYIPDFQVIKKGGSAA